MVETLPKKITIQDLYPNLSSQELGEAQENLRRYVNLVWRIYQRLKREGSLEAELANHRLKQDWEKRQKKSKR